jgi:hypothetical protein
VKRLSVGWQDDLATIVFEDPKRELTATELDTLFRGSRYQVVQWQRVRSLPGEPGTPAKSPPPNSTPRKDATRD